jgi:hypothetical protein
MSKRYNSVKEFLLTMLEDSHTTREKIYGALDFCTLSEVITTKEKQKLLFELMDEFHKIDHVQLVFGKLPRIASNTNTHNRVKRINLNSITLNSNCKICGEELEGFKCTNCNISWDSVRASTVRNLFNKKEEKSETGRNMEEPTRVDPTVETITREELEERMRNTLNNVPDRGVSYQSINPEQWISEDNNE